MVAGIRRQGAATGFPAPHDRLTNQEICTPFLHHLHPHVAPPGQIYPDAPWQRLGRKNSEHWCPDGRGHADPAMVHGVHP